MEHHHSLSLYKTHFIHNVFIVQLTQTSTIVTTFKSSQLFVYELLSFFCAHRQFRPHARVYCAVCIRNSNTVFHKKTFSNNNSTLSCSVVQDIVYNLIKIEPRRGRTTTVTEATDNRFWRYCWPFMNLEWRSYLLTLIKLSTRPNAYIHRLLLNSSLVIIKYGQHIQPWKASKM